MNVNTLVILWLLDINKDAVIFTLKGTHYSYSING